MKEKIFNKKSLFAFLFVIVLLLSGLLLLTTFKKDDSAKPETSAGHSVYVRVYLKFEGREEWYGAGCPDTTFWGGDQAGECGFRFNASVQFYDNGFFVWKWRDLGTVSVSSSSDISTRSTGIHGENTAFYVYKYVGSQDYSDQRIKVNSVSVNSTYFEVSEYQSLSSNLGTIQNSGDYKSTGNTDGDTYFNFYYNITRKSTAGTAVFYSDDGRSTLGSKSCPISSKYHRASTLSSSYVDLCSVDSNIISKGESYAAIGYHLYGWKSGSEIFSTNAVPVTSTWSSFKASYSPNLYELTLNQQGGSGGRTSVYATYNSPLPSITVPTRTGYTFQGYYTSQSGNGTKYYDANGAGCISKYTQTSGRTLYAYWTPNTYSNAIILNKWDGSKSYASPSYERTLPSVPVPTRTGYTFQGYYTSTGGSGTRYYTSSGTSSYTWTQTSGTLNLYDYWTPITYTVKYNSNGGSGSMANQTFTYGVSKNLTKNNFSPPTGKYFLGWNTSSSSTKAQYGNEANVSNLASTNTTVNLYAIWGTEEYKLRFRSRSNEYVNGSSNSYIEITRNYGANKITINSQSTATTGYDLSMYREGYRLTGFTTTDNTSAAKAFDFSNVNTNVITINNIPDLTSNSGPTQTQTTTIDLYACWAIEHYNVTFAANSGTINNGSTITNSYSYNETITTYNSKGSGSKNNLYLYKKGYNFTKFTPGDKTGSFTIPDLGKEGDSYTYTAQWQEKTYKLSFSANGASFLGNSPSAITGTYTSSVTLPNAERLGYLFAGWGTKSNGGTIFKFGDTKKMSDIVAGQEDGSGNPVPITLYAQWVETWGNRATKPATKLNNTVYTVSSVNNLGWIARELQANTNSFAGVTIQLTNNIDLGALPWLTSTNAFRGTFDGNGYHIYNIKSTDNANVVHDNEGLFGKTSGAKLMNISIMSGNLAGKEYVGGLAGYAENTIIRNCVSYAKVSGTSHVGGLVGKKTDTDKSNASATIIGCIGYGSVTGSGENVGGLFGYISNSKLEGCYLRANVTNNGGKVGGLIGKGENVTITGCAFVGNLTGTSTNGIASSLTGSIADCLIDSPQANTSFPVTATNCVVYKSGSTLLSPTNLDKWVLISGKYFPKALTWLA